MTITSCRQAFALEQLACAAAAATQDLVRSLYGLSRVGFAGSSMDTGRASVPRSNRRASGG